MPLINIPFSPRFLLAISGSLLKKSSTPEKTSFSKQSIEKLVVGRDAEKDIPRMAWQLGDDGNQILGVGPTGLKEKSEEVSADGKASVNLSLDEANALYAMGMPHLKGGMFNAPILLIENWLTLGYSLCQVPKANNEITREEGGLQVRRSLHEKNLTIPGVESAIGNFTVVNDLIESENDNDLHVYDYNFKIKQEGDRFDVSIDKDNYEFEIDDSIFYDFILPKAYQRLTDATTFDNRNTNESFTQQDLFLLIPCLCNPDFTKAFFKRLSNESSKIQKTADHLIALCFDNRPDDLKRIFESKTVVALENECERYGAHLQKIIDSKFATDKQKRNANGKKFLLNFRLLVCFEIKDDKRMIEEFSDQIDDYKNKFLEGGDRFAVKFIKAVLHILASLASAGLYAGGMALYSNKYRGSPKFWQSRDEIFVEKTVQEVKPYRPK